MRKVITQVRLDLKELDKELKLDQILEKKRPSIDEVVSYHKCKSA